MLPTANSILDRSNQQLFSKNAIKPLAVCPICLYEEQPEQVSSVTDIWPRDFPVFYCNHCGSYYLDQKPSPEEYTHFYRQEYYKPVSSYPKQAIKNWFRQCRTASQTEFLAKCLPKTALSSILEIGAGDGRFLHHVRTRTQTPPEKVLGLELSSQYSTYAQRQFGIQLISQDVFQLEQSFDLILMSHVFEHFLDLERFFAKLPNILTKNGFVFIEVPNSPRRNEIPQKELEHYLNTTHMHNFSVESLMRLWERYGYHIHTCERYVYNLPRFISETAKQKTAQLFLEGSGVDFASALTTLCYLGCWNWTKRKAYCPIPLHAPYWGLGDSIRLCVQKTRD